MLNKVSSKDYKFTKVLAGGVMPAHVDPQRTGVLMIPLTDSPSPIVFYDKDNNEIFSQNGDRCLEIAAAPPRYSSVFVSRRTKTGSFPDFPNASQKIY